MSQPQPQPKKKLGSRILRSVFVSVPIASLLGIIFNLAFTVMNSIAGDVVLSTGNATILGVTIGLSTGLGIELSKDLDES